MNHGAVGHSVLVSLLIFCAGVFSLEVGVSVAIAEIVAGVVGANLFGITPAPWIEMFATFGLLGIMFFAGFETDMALLRRTAQRSVTIGLVSFLVPFLGIFALMQGFWSFGRRPAALVAIALSTTSLALVYSILSERGLLARKPGQVILSAAMVVDVISMLGLAILFEGLSVSSVILVAVVVFSLLHLPRLGQWFFARYHQDRIEFGVRFIMLLLLSLVVVAEQAKVHVSILAFLAGMFFSSTMHAHEQLEAKLKSIVFGLMAPVFFFKAGLSVSIGSLSPGIYKYIVVLGVVAFGLKFLGTYQAFRWYYRRRFSRFAGLVFNYQLSFGIVAASFGFDHQIIAKELYLAIILIIILVSLASSLLLRTVPHD